MTVESASSQYRKEFVAEFERLASEQRRQRLVVMVRRTIVFGVVVCGAIFVAGRLAGTW